MHKIVIAFAAIFATAVSLSGCTSAGPAAASRSQSPIGAPAGNAVISIDGPQFESVEALSEAASIVVRGHFGNRLTSVSEGQLNTGKVAGLSMELWNFVVVEEVAGSEIVAGSAISVSQVSMAVDGAARPAIAGTAAVLFLNPYPSGDYSIVGLGAGAIYVDDLGALSVDPHASPLFAKAVAGLSFTELASTIRASIR